ncbi:Hypothetical predicted protein [Olea europaea subsp. europaea]|uniref:Uncharacterized protein n=1 Tax=Olea europaea subsp. europaea TaxID=158383 RepID=A0A8S0UMB5_OLEEU|nr:Hypothetical predicted protein [Olea europaea subsp. europaea]
MSSIVRTRDVSATGARSNKWSPAPGRDRRNERERELESAERAAHPMKKGAELPDCLRARSLLSPSRRRRARRASGWPAQVAGSEQHALGRAAATSVMMLRSVERRRRSAARYVRGEQQTAAAAAARDQEIVKSMPARAAVPLNFIHSEGGTGTKTTREVEVEVEVEIEIEIEEANLEGARAAKATSLRTTKYRVDCNQIKQQQEQQVRPTTDADQDQNLNPNPNPNLNQDEANDESTVGVVNHQTKSEEGPRVCRESLIDIEPQAIGVDTIGSAARLMRNSTSENAAPGPRDQQQVGIRERAFDDPPTSVSRKFSKTTMPFGDENMKTNGTSGDERNEDEPYGASSPGCIDHSKHPRPRGRTRRETSPWLTTSRQAKANELFLSKMPSIQRRVLVLLAVACLALASSRIECQPEHRQARAPAADLEDDLLAVLPPFAPTRRPAGAAQVLFAQRPAGPQQASPLMGYSDRTPDADNRAGQMPNLMQQQQQQQQPLHTSRQEEQQQQLGMGGHEQATAASSTSGSKFTRTNELDTFLDEMNHKELQTVASGRPIEDLFQPKPMSLTTSPVASHHQTGGQQQQQQPPPLPPGSGQAAGPGEKEMDADEPSGGGAGGPGGLMGSHSEQQVYSDCALILQRTYVKNIEDPK